MWPLLVHLLLLLTAHVLSSLSVLAFHSIHSRRTLHTDDKRTFDAHDAGAYAPASLRKRGARVRLRTAGWSRGVPRAATRTQAPHIVCAERRVVSFSKN